MKRKKGYIRTLAASLAASLLIPFGTAAEGVKDPWDLKTDPLVLTADDCKGGCKGHRVSGVTVLDGVGNGIRVESGTHDITLDHVQIDATKNGGDAAGAFVINEKAKVNLTLKGENILRSGNKAGINVQSGAELTVNGEDNANDPPKLTVSSEAGAGIGGDGHKPAGKITINSGTINATGGKGGAGIGGNLDGGAGTIVINGGVVNATGSSEEKTQTDGTVKKIGSAGIGFGSAGTSGKIIINGGKITAAPGEGMSYGISVGGDLNNRIRSDKAEGTAVIDAKVRNIDVSKFNGIIWNDDKSCEVYGRVTIDNSFELKKDQVMNMHDSTLTIPDGWNKFSGKIKGTGKIVNYDGRDAASTGEIDKSEDSVITPMAKLRADHFEFKKVSYNGKSFLDSGSTIGSTPIVDVADTKDGLAIDKFDWTWKIQKYDESDECRDVASILDVGKYRVACQRGDAEILLSENVVVTARDLKEAKIVLPKDTPQYNGGNAVEPAVTVQFGSEKPLLKDKDYTVEYTNNTEPTTETSKAKVTVKGTGNYTGELSAAFDISARSIAQANVTVTLTDNVYDGNDKVPTITVKLGTTTTLEEGKDYTISYRDKDGNEIKGAPKNAGEITVAATGMGNYTGEAIGKFTIKKKTLTCTGVKAADKEYDGSPAVTIMEAWFDESELVSGDHVEFDPEGKPPVVASAGSGTLGNAGVGVYDKVTITSSVMPLKGEDAGNYELKRPTSPTMMLSEPFEITKVKPIEAPVIKDAKEDYTVNEDNETFRYPLLLDKKNDKREYEYSMDSGVTWQTSNVFGAENSGQKLLPEKTKVFWARAKGDDNHEPGRTAELTKTFDKLTPGSRPADFKLTFAQNPDKMTYTATIPKPKTNPERVEYSFDGETYFSEEDIENPNIKRDCQAAEKCAGYIRYKETAVYKASDPAKNEQVVPRPLADTPVIGLDSGEYIGDQMITITSREPGVKIYYTLDGSNPTPGALSTIEYTEAFPMTKSGTVKAIAAKDNMLNSNVAEAKYTLITKNPIITPNGGVFVGPQQVEIKPGMDDVDIYYTTDGTAPTVNPKQKYEGPFEINSTNPVVQAISVRKGMELSDIVRAEFTMATVQKPVIAPKSGPYTGVQKVTITSETKDAVIYYTTDGNEPIMDSEHLYTGEFVIGATGTVKAIAVKAGMQNSAVAQADYVLKAEKPTTEPGEGEYTAPQKVSLQSVTEGAKIYYTLDGKDPVPEKSPEYTKPFTIDQPDVRVKAIAVKEGMENSDIMENDFTMSKVKRPVITPDGKGYTGAQQIVITSETKGADIYYTTDGKVPTEDSKQYTEPFMLDSSSVVQAIAVKEGMQNSDTAKERYTLKTENPVFVPAGGSFLGEAKVTIECNTKGAVIYYTTDESEPTKSNGIKYTKPFIIDSSAKIRAFAVKEGMDASEVTEEDFTVTEMMQAEQPRFTPNGGTFSRESLVTITTKTEGADIYYTTDGTDPTVTNSYKYEAPVMIDSSATLKAIAVKEEMRNSKIAEAQFILTAEKPVITPKEGNIHGTQLVTITSATKDAVIYYTTDGKTPTVKSTRYVEPFKIDASMTVKAIAVKQGREPSDVAEAIYMLATENPVITPDGGSFMGEARISIQCKTEDADIYYTIDETKPTEKSTKYTAPFTIDSSKTVKAFAVKKGMAKSDTVEAFIEVKEMKQTETPKITPDGGSFNGVQEVSLTSKTEGAEIYYTTDGKTPTKLSRKYTEPFKIDSSCVVRAIALNKDMRDSEIAEAEFVLTVAQPKVTPASGTLNGPQLVTMTTATEGAVIYYTTDGKTPTAKSERYTEPFTIDASATVQAVAVKPGMKDSEITKVRYTLVTAEPEITPNGGTFLGEVKVTLKCKTEGAEIYYTTDETQPTEKSQKYTKPFVLKESATVKAVAVKKGMTESKTAEAVFTVKELKPAKKPEITPDGGSFIGQQKITITTATEGGEIYYTTDGTEPTELSSRYTGPFVIDSSVTVKAVTVKKDMKNSEIAEAAFALKADKPEIAPDGGKFVGPQTVTITTKTKGAVIYYTTDGSEPTEKSERYTEPFDINKSVTVKAVAVKEGMENSKVAEASFEKAKAKKPEITPDGGKFFESKLVTITTKTEDAEIYYTTDGSEPDKNSKKYTEPFAINSSVTVKAVVIKAGMEDSDAAEASFEKIASTDLETRAMKDELKEVEKGLKDTEFNSIDKIKAELAKSLYSQLGEGYNHQNIVYYDVTLEMKADGGEWTKATIENFPKDGLTVYLPFPKEIKKDKWEEYDFAVSHMFAGTSERLGVKAGKIEEPEVEKTAEGLKFTLRSTSPVAIGWKVVENTDGGDKNNGGNNNQGNNAGNNNQNNQNNQNTDKPDGTDKNQNNAGDGQGADNQNGSQNNGGAGNNDQTPGADGGNSQNGTNADANADNRTGGVGGLISSILPKTGDTSSIVRWALLGTASIAVIVILIIRRKRR